MNFVNILLGIVLIILGMWLTINRIKAFMKGVQETLGGSSGLLIIGVGMTICGVIEIIQHV